MEKEPISVKTLKVPKKVHDLLEDSLDSLMLLLEEEWEKQGIPDAQRDPFRECIEAIDLDPAKIMILKEIEDLQKGKANSQLALRAVAAREESLKSVKDMNDYLNASENWDKEKEIQIEAAELLHAHRMLTVNAIEAIVKWRGQMHNSFKLSPHHFPFMWEGENYLLRLRDDLDFLKQSEYAKILYFGEDTDPLLIYPSVPSGKLEKNRKRDANYFLNDGQVIVPLPSTMKGRVKESEDEVRKEYDWVRLIEENDPKRLANFYGPGLVEQFVDEVLDEFISSLTGEVEKEKEKMEKDRLRDLENDDLAEKIYFDLFNRLNAEIEHLANEEQVTEIALMKSMKSNKADEDNQLAILIRNWVLDGLVDNFLIEISEEALEEMLKEDAEEKSVYERGNILEEMGLDFANTELFSDLSEVMWVPIGISEEYIEEALEEYYRFIPSLNRDVVPEIPLLLNEVTKAIDTRWYWAIRQKKIFALLIFSIDCYSKTGRKLIVHHLSSLYWKALPPIIESATQHMWKIDNCDETRLAMFSRLGQDLTPEVKKVLNLTKYKWKSQFTLKEANYDVITFGRSRPNTAELPVFIPFRLKAFCALHSSENPVNDNQNISEDMAQVGNRQIFLNSLLGLIGKLEKAELKISQIAKTPLQKEISDILNLMNQSQSFSFPNMKGITSESQSEIDEFCRSNNLPPRQIHGQKASFTLLDVNFRWVSCTNIVQAIRGKGYKYMRLKSKEIICTTLEDTTVIKVPTEMPNIFAFFIENKSVRQEIRKSLEKKLDMFCVTETLLRKGEKGKINEVWVPCFNKAANMSLPWIEGYELVKQREEFKSSYITSCFEETSLSIDQNLLHEGLLVLGKKQGPVLMHDFIFGLMYSKGDKILDIPLFCCLVEEKDWIQSL